MKKIIVSVIIPVYNEIDFLGNCLDGILNNGYPHDNLEIIVIDGGSVDGTDILTRTYQEKFDFIKLVLNNKRTVPYALNMAIKQAVGNYIIRIDAHAKYPYGYINNLLKYLELLSADNVGGVLLTSPSEDTMNAKAVSYILSHPFGVGNSKFRIGVNKEYVKVDTVPFGCYRRNIFDKIGYFDVSLTRNQDDEFNARLISAGGSIYLIPSIIVEYYSRPTIKKMCTMLFQYGYFKPLVSMKIGKTTSVRQLIPPLFVLMLFVLLFAEFFLAGSVYLVVFLLLLHIFLGIIFSVNSRGSYFILLLLPLGFMAAHISYGAGYLLGVIDFYFRRKHLKEVNVILNSR